MAIPAAPLDLTVRKQVVNHTESQNGGPQKFPCSAEVERRCWVSPELVQTPEVRTEDSSIRIARSVRTFSTMHVTRDDKWSHAPLNDRTSTTCPPPSLDLNACVTPGPLPVAGNGVYRLELCSPLPLEIHPRLPARGSYSYPHFEATYLVLKISVASEGMHISALLLRLLVSVRWLRLSSLARHPHPSRVPKFSSPSTTSPPTPLLIGGRTTTPPTYPSPPTSLASPRR